MGFKQRRRKENSAPVPQPCPLTKAPRTPIPSRAPFCCLTARCASSPCCFSPPSRSSSSPGRLCPIPAPSPCAAMSAEPPSSSEGTRCCQQRSAPWLRHPATAAAASGAAAAAFSAAAAAPPANPAAPSPAAGCCSPSTALPPPASPRGAAPFLAAQGRVCPVLLAPLFAPTVLLSLWRCAALPGLAAGKHLRVVLCSEGTESLLRLQRAR